MLRRRSCCCCHFPATERELETSLLSNPLTILPRLMQNGHREIQRGRRENLDRKLSKPVESEREGKRGACRRRSVIRSKWERNGTLDIKFYFVSFFTHNFSYFSTSTPLFRFPFFFLFYLIFCLFRRKMFYVVKYFRQRFSIKYFSEFASYKKITNGIKRNSATTTSAHRRRIPTKLAIIWYARFRQSNTKIRESFVVE